jgi:hypothetical protein
MENVQKLERVGSYSYVTLQVRDKIEAFIKGVFSVFEGIRECNKSM